jgi:quercetin dioxygenase-like cupin family protein
VENLSISSDGQPSTPVTPNPNPNPSPNEVFALEREMLKRPQVELPVREYRTSGVYARELTIYAGCVLTGHAHRYPQINILSSGTIRVLTEDGIIEVSAPFTVVSPAGTKRIAYAVTDCVWTTILGTDLCTEQIEQHFLLKTEEEYNEWLSQQVQLSQDSALQLPE